MQKRVLEHIERRIYYHSLCTDLGVLHISAPWTGLFLTVNRAFSHRAFAHHVF